MHFWNINDRLEAVILDMQGNRETSMSGEFVVGAKGRLFVLYRNAPGNSGRYVLVVPPFAEEMNKCRKMIAMTALRLATYGVGTVVPDLSGTGDSELDFEDADWSTWSADLALVHSHIAKKGHTVIGVLGIRLGAALATAVASESPTWRVERSVFWQPAFDGPKHLSQFLRVRVSGSMMQDERRETLQGLRARLQAGETLEVAGYRLSGQFAKDLDALLQPSCLPEGLGKVAWMEIVRELEGQLPTPSTILIDASRAEGVNTEVRRFLGEPFWASAEIAYNLDMLESTAKFLAAHT
jgi:exosortase A-associated hydrolase 2